MEKNVVKSSEEKKVVSNVSVENKSVEPAKPVVINEQKSVSSLPSTSSKMRENPWMISTIVLILILVGFIIFGGIGKGNNGGVTGNVVSGQTAAGNLISFIESQSQGNASDVSIVSTVQEGQLYKVTVDYMGQNVPVYVSLDGKYLIADPIPLDTTALAANTANTGSGNTGPVDVELGDSPFEGKANAPVTIVEFSDFQCPYCGRFFNETLPLIDKNYIKTGKVKFVYKNFPLSFHENAEKAAEAALCVREQKGDTGFFKMHDKMYANQEDLSVENLKKWAKELGVDSAKFDQCLDNGKFADTVAAELAYGQQIGVSGTPAFFINGNLISGAQPYSVFQQMIDVQLSASGSATPKASASPTVSVTPLAA